MVTNLMSLNNELIVNICSYLDFQPKYQLSRTQVEIRKYVINDITFINQYQSHASNFIKFWWLSRKIGKESICIVKNNNIVDNDIINMVIDNFICIYDPTSITNVHYHTTCKEFNKLPLYKPSYPWFFNCLSTNTEHNKINKQFLTLRVHPFIILYLKNKETKYIQQYHNYLNYKTYIQELSQHYRIVKSDDIYYNKLNYKKILLSLV